MSTTTSNNININNKSNDKEIIAGETKVRRSGRTPKPSEKVRDRTLGSPNGIGKSDFDFRIILLCSMIFYNIINNFF
jgi:hypothetical protein